LQLGTNGVWRMEPAGWAVDSDTVNQFLGRVSKLRIAQFAKDVVAEPDLPSFGLGTPALRLTLNPAPPAPGLQLDFSAPVEGKVNVRRGDESAVYALEATALEGLPVRDGDFRDRRIWRFETDQVTAVSVQQGERSWQVLHKGKNEWSLAPGSQGLVNPFAVEEAVARLSQLNAVVWTAWNGVNLASYGLDGSARTMLIDLKDGTRPAVRLGTAAPSGHIYAAVTLDGREWVFEFPLEAYDALQFALLTPAGLR
ncbi:MAG: DUF4340 domain-containing protein, partial [Verrucomicrobia bacterium]|nr:DUF4340 domain-containing protein [Verrucomicrobiota bacterium]